MTTEPCSPKPGSTRQVLPAVAMCMLALATPTARPAAGRSPHSEGALSACTCMCVCLHGCVHACVYVPSCQAAVQCLHGVAWRSSGRRGSAPRRSEVPCGPMNPAMRLGWGRVAHLHGRHPIPGPLGTATLQVRPSRRARPTVSLTSSIGRAQLQKQNHVRDKAFPTGNVWKIMLRVIMPRGDSAPWTPR